MRRTVCFCPRHRPTSFAEIAPRLARAHANVVRQRREARELRGRLREAVLKRERLVAHRELQLARAFATNHGGYISTRRRKLDAARKELAAYTRRLNAAERAA